MGRPMRLSREGAVRTLGDARTRRRTSALLTAPLLCLGGIGAPLAAERPGAPPDGPYFSFTMDRVSSFSLHTTSPTLSPGRIRTRPGYQLGAGVGYRWDRTRIEAGLVYGRSDADSVRFGEGGGSLSGYFDLWGTTLEVFRDFSAGARLQPYVGAGFGLVRFRAHDVTLAGFPPTVGANTLFTWQLMAGMAYAMDGGRLSVGYRYQRLGGQEFSTGADSLHAAPVGIGAIRAGIDLAF